MGLKRLDKKGMSIVTLILLVIIMVALLTGLFIIIKKPSDNSQRYKTYSLSELEKRGITLYPCSDEFNTIRCEYECSRGGKMLFAPEGGLIDCPEDQVCCVYEGRGWEQAENSIPYIEENEIKVDMSTSCPYEICEFYQSCEGEEIVPSPSGYICCKGECLTPEPEDMKKIAEDIYG